jgi:hypothetical protein
MKRVADNSLPGLFVNASTLVKRGWEASVVFFTHLRNAACAQRRIRIASFHTE